MCTIVCPAQAALPEDSYMASPSPAQRILLVEDSPTQAKKLQRILESAGFEVVLATEGNQALKLFESANFDLVLSDVVMPGMTGFELCRQIKSNSKRRSVPVILLTSLCGQSDRERGLASGADEFLNKPYDGASLLQHIGSLIQRCGNPGKKEPQSKE